MSDDLVPRIVAMLWMGIPILFVLGCGFGAGWSVARGKRLWGAGWLMAVVLPFVILMFSAFFVHSTKIPGVTIEKRIIVQPGADHR